MKHATVVRDLCPFFVKFEGDDGSLGLNEDTLCILYLGHKMIALTNECCELFVQVLWVIICVFTSRARKSKV